MRERVTVLLVGFFFFSSRRRHTRLQGDWSSDVCSSDLVEDGRVDLPELAVIRLLGLGEVQLPHEIGRAAWRGRGEISGGAGSLKKKKERRGLRRGGTLKHRASAVVADAPGG